MRGKKIKILFHYSRLNVGGAERSTLRLVNCLANEGWDVTLVLNVGRGKLEEKLDKRIEVIRFFPRPWMAEFVNRETISQKLPYLLYAGFPVLFYTLFTFFRKHLFRFRRYDAAIISLQGLDPSFVCRYVNAKCRFLYIRSDLKSVKKRAVFQNIKRFNHLLNGFLCVSDTVLQSLDVIDPELKAKAHVLYNIIDVEGINILAHAGDDPYQALRSSDTPILVTVCRMSDVSKALFRQLDAAEQLRDEGVKFRWYFAGDGPDLVNFKRIIAQKRLGEHIVPLGELSNPYPYIKYADLVCVLSYYEGLSGVVNEAKILGRAVITTEFSGVHEQLIHKKNGFITGNNLQDIVWGLKTVITDHDLRLTMQNHFLGSGIGDNQTKIDKLKAIIQL